MKHLKLYSTVAEFETAKFNLDRPYIAYDKTTVYYSNDLDKGPLCFIALEPSTICIMQYGDMDYINASANKDIQYSTDGGTWNTYDIGETIELSIGDKIYFKSDDTKPMAENYYDEDEDEEYDIYKLFIMSGKLAASGSIQSLMNNSNSVPEFCYTYLFYNCTSLITAPKLPATSLALWCYFCMFSNCTSLIAAPELPATVLANNCYNNMFSNCTSLTKALELPATTLTSACYFCMFNGCTSLTKAPELPATTLVNNCYNSMFLGCTNLNYVKAMFLQYSGDWLNNWLSGVSSTGTFVKNSNATWNVSGVRGIPGGWTVETATA